MKIEDRISIFREMMGFLPEGALASLIEEGYFTAPASTKYHGNYEGGLFDHSFAVTETLVKLTEQNDLRWMHPRSPWVVGMFHDLCKIDNYTRPEIGMHMDGTPIYDPTSYEYNENTLYKGHGDKSVMLLSSYLSLTPEEVACIRYHMGAFTDKAEWNYYTRAVRQFPNVLWTHHADMIASQIKGV